MSNPVIILTGASKGLGLAIASILLKQYSAKLVAVSRSVPEGLKALVDSHDGDVQLVTGMDQCSAKDAARLISRFNR